MRIIESMTFQALSQDLLRVSVRLETLEEQLQSSSSVRQTGGVTMEELEKERDMLKKRRDTLDSQLKDNRVLTVEVRKTRTLNVCIKYMMYVLYCTGHYVMLFIVHRLHLFFILCTLMCVCLDVGGAFPASAGGSY